MNQTQHERDGETTTQGKGPIPGVTGELNAAWGKTGRHNPTLRAAKRIVVAMVGGTVLLVGIALLVLPGPAVLVIPAGLGILAIEFGWARRWLKRLKSLVPNMNNNANAKRNTLSAPISDGKSDAP